MKLEVYKQDGTKSGETVELSKEIFEIEPNDHVIYLAVKAYLANQRQGTHKAKERKNHGSKKDAAVPVQVQHVLLFGLAAGQYSVLNREITDRN